MAAESVNETLSIASDNLVVVMQVIGTIGFAVSGAMAAARHRMDPFGIIVLGIIVAVGGGTLRDVLLDVPVGWIDDWWVLLVAAGSATIAMPLAIRLGSEIDSTGIVLAADAVGLAVFATLGCDKAIRAGAPMGICIVIGVITGIAGGIVRDVLVGDTPAVFTGQVYAVAALAGTSLYVGLLHTDMHRVIVLWLPILLTFALRMYAIRRSWTVSHLPIDHP